MLPDVDRALDQRMIFILAIYMAIIYEGDMLLRLLW